MTQKNLIDSIWEEISLTVQFDPDFYDMLRITPEAYKQIEEEYKKLFGLKKDKRISPTLLEQYFGLTIVVEKGLNVRYQLDKDL